MIENKIEDMHKKNIVIFSLLSIVSISCDIRNNSEMIEFASENIIEYENELDRIINWIQLENYNNSTYFDLISGKDSLNIFCLDKDQPQVTLDEEFTNFLIRFYKDFGIYRINIGNNRVILRSEIRNQNWNSYGFIWYEEEITSNSYYGFKVYNKEIPKEESGWLYKLNDNWYLESSPNSN